VAEGPSAPVGAGTNAGAASCELVVARDPFAVAGARLAEWLHAIADEDGRRAGAMIRLAIPGGSALAAVGHALPALRSLAARIALTWVDERCVPVADAESNRGEALRRGLYGAPGGPAPAPARVLPLFEDGESPSSACARVERCYAQDFAGGLDVAVLGLGADGHVASLFPERAAQAPSPDGTTPAVAFVPDAPKAPPRRVTLTRAALASARRVLLVAAGEEKRGALERLLAGDPRLPATGLPGLVVVTDLALAGGTRR